MIRVVVVAGVGVAALTAYVVAVVRVLSHIGEGVE